jgi:hypothetical protein
MSEVNPSACDERREMALDMARQLPFRGDVQAVIRAADAFHQALCDDQEMVHALYVAIHTHGNSPAEDVVNIARLYHEWLNPQPPEPQAQEQSAHE